MDKWTRCSLFIKLINQNTEMRLMFINLGEEPENVLEINV